MNANAILHDALAEYIGALLAGLRVTKHATDREFYKQHLADAAVLFHALQEGDVAALKTQLEQSQRTCGWSLLPGDEGNAAEKAFYDFARRANDPSNWR